MAKSLHEIEMDFRAAKSLAERLDGLAKKMDNLANDRFEGTLRSISNNWKGENAGAYTRKGSKVQLQMTRTVTDLRNAASTIREIAQNTRDAEERSYYEILNRTNQ